MDYSLKTQLYLIFLSLKQHKPSNILDNLIYTKVIITNRQQLHMKSLQI